MSAVRREAARRGGKRTAQLHDMAMIGKAGGRQTAKRSIGYYARIGRLGGRALKPTAHLVATD